MRIVTLACAAALACLAFQSAAGAAEVRGTVNEPSVVWINDGSSSSKDVLDMRNKDRQFVPGLLIARVGQSVRFPNDDSFYHSIYSASPADPFDIGYYGNGPGKVISLDKAGVVEVRCHIHFSMHGVIIVTDGPSTTGLTKSFDLTNVQPGSHTLYIRNEKGDLKTKNVVIPNANSTIDLGGV